MNVRTEALAYRIWAHCEPLGWDCTVKDVAEALGVKWQRVNAICQHRNWTNRMRHSATSAFEYAHSIGRMDDRRSTDNALDGGSYHDTLRMWEAAE